MAAVDQDLLGGGLDIEGWSYIKKEVAAKIADMTDRTTVLRNTFPMLMRSKLESDQQKQIIHELVTTTLEAKSVIDVSFIAESLKRNLDKAFGHPWHVIVGESYSFDIEYDSEFFHYFFYGPIAVLAFKCGSILPSEINHLMDRRGAGGIDPKMMVKKKKEVELI